MKTVISIVASVGILFLVGLSAYYLVPVLAHIQEREQSKPDIEKMSYKLDSMRHVLDSVSRKLDIANAENAQMRKRLEELNDGKKWQQTQILKLTETLREQNKKWAQEKLENE